MSVPRTVPQSTTSPTLLFDYPTIDELSDYLTKLVSGIDPSHDSAQAIETRIFTPSDMARNEERQIAIIGMSCRLPGGLEGPGMLWDAVRAGRSMVGKVPLSRWDAAAEAAKDPNLDDDVRQRMMFGGFVDDLELFDAAFFGISHAEASAMDPQQRLLLEYSYLAFVDAGYSREDLKGRNVGVFVAFDVDAEKPELEEPNLSANNTRMLCCWTYIFTFDLHGPCMHMIRLVHHRLWPSCSNSKPSKWDCEIAIVRVSAILSHIQA